MQVRSAASTLAGFSIAGPRSRELLQRLVRIDLSAAGVQALSRSGDRGGFCARDPHPRRLHRRARLRDLDDAGLLRNACTRICGTAGRDLGLTHFGGRALSSLRLEKGYGSFNKDFRPDYTPAETGLDRFVDFEKADFIGRSAALAERAAGPRRRFVVMEVADADAEVVGYESIMKDGAAVGYVTSGAYGHCIGRSLAAGYVPTALAREGARFEIDILGEMRAATVHLEAALRSTRPAAARIMRRRVLCGAEKPAP